MSFWDQLYYKCSYISWKVWDCDSNYWRMALSSSDQCFSPSLSFPPFYLLTAFHSWSQVTEKFHSSGSLYCGGKMGIYSLLAMFSWKLTASSQTLPCFGDSPHSGNYSWLCFPLDNVSSKRFFRDCSNGPAIHCEMVLNEIAFLWQLYSESEKRMKYWMKIICSGCTLWKTLLGNAYHRKLTYQVLKY